MSKQIFSALRDSGVQAGVRGRWERIRLCACWQSPTADTQPMGTAQMAYRDKVFLSSLRPVCKESGKRPSKVIARFQMGGSLNK